MAAFPAEIIFKATDKVTGPIRKMGRNIDRTMKLASASVNRFNRGLDKIGGKAAGAFGIGGVAGGAFLAQKAMRSVIETGLDFEQTLVNAAAKFPDGIRRGTEAFKELEKAAEDVGRTTIFSATEAANGLNFLAMAGFNAEESIALLPTVTDLAIASQTDLATATDIASDALGAFGLASGTTEEKTAGLTRVVDVMAKTTTSANTTMEAMFEAIKEGGPVATAAGASVETFAALVGVLANSGIKGSKAGTTLKNVFLKLQAPTAGAVAVLKKLNVQTEIAGEFRDVTDIMEDLGGALEGLGSGTRAKILDEIFGKIPIAGVNVLLEEGADGIRKYRKELEDAGGAAKTMAEIMGDTAQAALKTMMSSVESLGLGLFKLNRDSISGVIEGATEWIRTIDSAIRSNDELAQKIQGDFIKTITGAGKIVGGFIAVIVGLKTAVFAANLAITAYKVAVVAFKVAMVPFKLIMMAITAAQWLWNAAMAANPIGAIIIAVAALGAGAALLIANWDSVSEFFTGLWDNITEGIKTALSWIEKLLKPFREVQEGVGGILEAFGLSSGDDNDVDADKTSDGKKNGGGFFDTLFGDDEETDDKKGVAATTPPSIRSPEMRTARQIQENVTTNKTEVTIADQTGKASMTGPAVPGVKLLNTAAS